jgi:homoserine O-acetyltransferase
MKSNAWSQHDFPLNEFPLVSGSSLKKGHLRYYQIGALNAPKDNLILLPTYFGGSAAGVMPWVDHSDSPLDPTKYCIVIPCMLGAGESSSPSNTPEPQAGPDFPRIDLADNIHAQSQLVASEFHGAKLRLVAGWSMGGLQSLYWAAMYPRQVSSAMAVCATARCYPHNQIFLDGVAASLRADAAFTEGYYCSPPEKGLIAFARVYLSWAYSQAFFRDQLYQALGFDTLNDLVRFWEEDHLAQDANDLLCVIDAWQQADVFARLTPGQQLNSSLLMPSDSDLYFTHEDARADTAALGAQFALLESPFGHIAGGPGRLANETRTIFKAMAELLGSDSLLR